MQELAGSIFGIWLLSGNVVRLPWVQKGVKQHKSVPLDGTLPKLPSSLDIGDLPTFQLTGLFFAP